MLDREIAAQDLRGGDLDGDGTPDVVAVGGSTHNVVWYRPKKTLRYCNARLTSTGRGHRKHEGPATRRRKRALASDRRRSGAWRPWSRSAWSFRKSVSESPGSSRSAQVPLLAPHATTIAPGIHMLGGLRPSAAYVVETSEGLVLIDSGEDSNATGAQDGDDRAGARLAKDPRDLDHPCPRRPQRRSRAPAAATGAKSLRRRGRRRACSKRAGRARRSSAFSTVPATNRIPRRSTSSSRGRSDRIRRRSIPRAGHARAHARKHLLPSWSGRPARALQR